jgi:uncharacterized surface protein with fasciclin (FAS1) repeats
MTTMKTFKLVYLLTPVALSATFLISGCSGNNAPPADTPAEQFDTHGQSGVVDRDSDMNILQIAAASDDHTTLATAATAAEMLDVLANPGPLTVFAPTNAAFEKLPPGTVEDLLKPENKETLVRIIQFHASPGKYMGQLLESQSRLFMASGHYVDVEVRDDGTYVNGSKIVATIEASNGVVHVVEDVFLPPAEE